MATPTQAGLDGNPPRYSGDERPLQDRGLWQTQLHRPERDLYGGFADSSAGSTDDRQAITDFWANLIQSVNAKSAALASVDVMPAGDGVVEIGRATLTVAPQGQTTEMEVEYVVYWRQEDGKWKWHVDIWNPNS
jgi:hypothetical protein